MWTVVLALVVLHSTAADIDSPLVDFVIESFDNEAVLGVLDIEPAVGQAEPFIDNPAFGKGSLSLDCESLNGSLILESIQPKPNVVYNALHATSVSFWYGIHNSTARLPTEFRFTFSILDSTWCRTVDCSAEARQLEAWQYTFDTSLVANSGWQEAKIPLSPELWRRTDGMNDGVLDLRTVKGWNMMIDFGDSDFSGLLKFDHLAFHGEGDMVGAAFEVESWDEATANSLITRKIFDSSLSEDSTTQSFGNGTMTIDYLVEQRAVWGGFAAYELFLPDRAYYNLSRADEIAFDYSIPTNASPAQRLHLRLNVVDMSDCDNFCDDVLNVENYYSFHYVLDTESHNATTARVWLVGDKSFASSFSLTGWVGQNGNEFLDTSWVNGFKFEINMNQQGEVGDIVQGQLALSGLRVHQNVEARETGVYLPFVEEPDFSLLAEKKEGFERLEFTNAFECMQHCLASSNCTFAMSTRYGLDCYMTGKLERDAIVLKTTTYLEESTVTFWKDTLERREDYCTICDCIEEDLLIDCRGRGLSLPPKTFSPTTTWLPKRLDLRENPELLIVGRAAFEAFSSLTQLLLSRDVVYLSPEALAGQPDLQEVEFFEDGESKVVENGLLNAIGSDTEAFGSKCCTRGETNAQNLTWCNMQVYKPGIDSVYENFTQYLGVHSNLIVPSTTFLSEASESPEKCAEICSILEDCNFFSHDNRYYNAHPVCWHFSSVETTVYDCCRAESYSDINRTAAGWVSGRVAATRQILDEAKVVIEAEEDDLILSEENNFTSRLRVRLGANPTRGAVWVTLSAPESLSYHVKFTPADVVLYDSRSHVSVAVEALNMNSLRENMPALQTFSVSTSIEACDTAFHESVLVDQPLIAIRFIERKFLPITGVTFAASVGLLGILSAYAFAVYRHYRRRDPFWLVKLSDLEFSDPPVVLGRGTFGIVTKAVYRGTTVSVKRALPSAEQRGGLLSYQRGLQYSRAQLCSPSHPTSFDLAIRRIQDWKPNANKRFEHEQTECSAANENEEGSVMSSTSSLELAREEYWERKLKMVKKSESHMRTSFMKEMKTLSELRHPCITTIMGAVIEQKVDETLLVVGTLPHLSGSPSAA